MIQVGRQLAQHFFAESLPPTNAFTVICHASCTDFLYLHRLEDGVRVLTTKPPETIYVPVHMAADSVSGMVYQKTPTKSPTRWRCESRSATLDPIAGGSWHFDDEFGPMAIFHRQGAAGTALESHIAVGGDRIGSVFVFELETMRLVHTHHLEGCERILALAADPGGCSIAVCDNALGAVKVLPWPLPGMCA